MVHFDIVREFKLLQEPKQRVGSGAVEPDRWHPSVSEASGMTHQRGRVLTSEA